MSPSFPPRFNISQYITIHFSSSASYLIVFPKLMWEIPCQPTTKQMYMHTNTPNTYTCSLQSCQYTLLLFNYLVCLLNLYLSYIKVWVCCSCFVALPMRNFTNYFKCIFNVMLHNPQFCTGMLQKQEVYQAWDKFTHTVAVLYLALEVKYCTDPIK